MENFGMRIIYDCKWLLVQYVLNDYICDVWIEVRGTCPGKKSASSPSDDPCRKKKKQCSCTGVKS